MIRELIDIVGGLSQVKRGVIEGLPVVALIAVIYLLACAVIPFR